VPVPPSIEEFVAARGDALLRFALMLSGDAHRAEDLVQSALARAYLRWNRIADLDAPEAYLKRMVVNEHLRWRARRSSREVPVQSTGSDVAAGDNANAHAERDAAWELLRTLPRRQRAVLVLRYYEDLPDADIASLLGCRESTVRSQAARGLAALRAVLPTMQREWTSS
jgi:RNA polymerase sigma-70 factor (sigma-E family)